LIFFSTILKFDFNPKLCFTFLVDMHKMKPQNVLGVSKTTKLNYDLMESCKIKRRNLLNTIQMFSCSKIRQQSTILYYIILEFEWLEKSCVEYFYYDIHIILLFILKLLSKLYIMKRHLGLNWLFVSMHFWIAT
jgi:hypothetical protein